MRQLRPLCANWLSKISVRAQNARENDKYTQAARFSDETNRHLLKRLVIACSVLILTIWLCSRPRQIGPGMDLSGEYVAQIQTTSAGFDKPFLPDSLMWDHAHVTITQSGAMHITCVSRTDNGLAVTNAIVVRRRPWNWVDNGLEYKSTRIGPGFGFGVFPGVLKCKIRCRVSVVPSNGSLRESLCVKTDNQVSGFTLPFGFWSDPVNYSEVILTPIGTKDQVDDTNFPTARDGYAQHPSPPSPPQSTHSSVVDIKPVSPKATSGAEADHFDVSVAIAAICGADPATADRYEARNDALRTIARNRNLPTNDVATLTDWLASTNDALRVERVAALKHDVLNLFLPTVSARWCAFIDSAYNDPWECFRKLKK